MAPRRRSHLYARIGASVPSDASVEWGQGAQGSLRAGATFSALHGCWWADRQGAAEEAPGFAALAKKLRTATGSK
jgi:hypothetical protein